MHWKLKLQRCGVFCHFRILLCPWAWSWSAVSFRLAKMAADVLQGSPQSAWNISSCYSGCAAALSPPWESAVGNRPFSKGRWAQIWPMPSGFTGLHSRASMNLRDRVRLDWSGHERGEVRPTKSGLTVSSQVLMLWGPPSTKAAFLLVSVFWEFSLNRGSRIANSWWQRFTIWEIS